MSAKQKPVKKTYRRGGGKRNEGQRLADIEFVQEFYLKGYTSRQIADKLAEVRNYTLSHSVICEDIKIIKARIEEEISLEARAHVGTMFKKMELQERELWQAWEASKGNLTRTITDKIEVEGSKGKKKVLTNVRKIVQPRDGSQQFQHGLRKLNDQKRQLLGLDQPKRQILQDAKGEPLEFIIRLSEEELP